MDYKQMAFERKSGELSTSRAVATWVTTALCQNPIEDYRISKSRLVQLSALAEPFW